MPEDICNLVRRVSDMKLYTSISSEVSLIEKTAELAREINRHTHGLANREKLIDDIYDLLIFLLRLMNDMSVTESDIRDRMDPWKT